MGDSFPTNSRWRLCCTLGHYQIRYADVFIIGFTDESDARRVMEVLPKRFGKYGLSIHPDKTRLVPFARPQEQKGRTGLRKLAGAVISA